MSLGPECRQALDAAKAAVPEGERLTAAVLMAALHANEQIKKRFPVCEEKLPALRRLRDPATVKVPLNAEIKPVLSEAINSDEEWDAACLWNALAATPAGAAIVSTGVPAKRADQAAVLWRATPQRRSAVQALSSFGRFLTDLDLSQRSLGGKQRAMSSLVRTLSKMKRRNALIVGHPGTGKSALVYELARRMRSGDESLPPHLRDCDIFELSSAFLRSGASVVGQYEERVKALIAALKKHPQIILFIDEAHSFFQSGVHHHGPFSDANESFKAELGRGEICVIGCTTLSEYRNFIEPDGALTRRFTLITVDPPDAAETADILRRKKESIEHYHKLALSDEMITETVALADEHLVKLYQPDKSIQLLDTACAFASTANPPASELERAHLVSALEEITGRRIDASRAVTVEEVRSRLDSALLGQKAVNEPLARAFVAGLGRFRKQSATRGVFLLAGPTGTGKTKAALELAAVLGENTLLRVDCNTLSGNASDPGPAISRLLGTNKGYIGYVRGEGGLLSKVRDMPESVVLFDEIEKAPPAVFNILLQIIDSSKVEDSDGNPLDFRRSFILFTTNAGCRYWSGKTLGFSAPASQEKPPAEVTKESVYEGLRNAGCGEEFLGRIGQTFVFAPLDRDTGRAIVAQGLKDLEELVSRHGFTLEAANDFGEHLLQNWNPRFGARHVLSILKNRVVEQLGVADAQGELAGVTAIRLAVFRGDTAQAPGGARRMRDGNVLVIEVA